MDTTFIFLGVAVVILLYTIFFFMGGKDSLATKVDLLQIQAAIPSDKITKPESVKYSFELWTYVYGSNDGMIQNKYFFSRDAATPGTRASKNKNIGLKMGSAGTPSLLLEYNKPGAATSTTVQVTDNFPLQTWQHIIVSVDNKFIDVYMNGKLVKSIKDDIETPSPTSNIDFSKSPFKTHLAKFTRTITPTDPQTAWNNYLAGNGENPLKNIMGNYGVSMSFKKDDQDAYQLNLL
jgi:hypothetical protein